MLIKSRELFYFNQNKMKRNMKKLYLDDVRTPKSKGWYVVRNYNDFVNWITENGLPDEVSFDHDLGDVKVKEGFVIVEASDWNNEKTGYDCAKWMCEYCYTNGLPIPPWNVHSANPVGRDNIIQILKKYEKELNY